MCYNAEFGRSTLKGADTQNPQNWEALEFRSLGMRGVADLEIHASLHVRYRVIVLRQRMYA